MNVIISFPKRELALQFMTWLCDAGGEQQYFDFSSQDDFSIDEFEYRFEDLHIHAVESDREFKDE